MSFSGKRSRNVLSIETKIEIIDRLERGERGSALAKIYNVGKATISDIKCKKETILRFALKCDSEEGSRSRKTMKKPRDEQLEAAVYSWFLQRRIRGEPISGPMLCEKALEFNTMIKGSPDFKASNGWLKNFKSRHGIRGPELQAKSSQEECRKPLADVAGKDDSFKRQISAIDFKGVPLQQNEGAITGEPLPSTSTTRCETVVAEDESMEKEDLTSIKYEEVYVSEDEEKEVPSGFHDYTPTAMTGVSDISADLEDPLPTLHPRADPQPMVETVAAPAEGYSVRREKEEPPSPTDSAPDVNELFAKYLTAELRSLHPDDAALLRKKIHILVADFMIYERGARANVQEQRVSGSERRS